LEGYLVVSYGKGIERCLSDCNREGPWVLGSLKLSWKRDCCWIVETLLDFVNVILKVVSEFNAFFVKAIGFDIVAFRHNGRGVEATELVPVAVGVIDEYIRLFKSSSPLIPFILLP
jgi:hypothetical protein